MSITTTFTPEDARERKTVTRLFATDGSVSSVSVGELHAIPTLASIYEDEGVFFPVLRGANLVHTGYEVQVCKAELPDYTRRAIRLCEANGGYFVDEFNSIEAALEYVLRHGDRINA